MLKRIIYEDSEGNCRIICPDPRFKQKWESDDEALGRLYAAAIPDVIEFIVCAIEKIPSDTTFREAWKKGDLNEPIKIDLQKAMVMHRSHIQMAAEEKIKQLNTELDKAIEDDNLPGQVSVRKTKKILRSIHQMDLSHCKNSDDIKYSIPKELYDVWRYYSPVRPSESV